MKNTWVIYIALFFFWLNTCTLFSKTNQGQISKTG